MPAARRGGVMGNDPQTWHYGLIARWWAEFNTEPALEELAFYRAVVERNGQPALDLGCGAGPPAAPLAAGRPGRGWLRPLARHARPLPPIGRPGTGLTAPRLYQQAMHELDLPRTYRTIFICRFLRHRWQSRNQGMPRPFAAATSTSLPAVCWCSAMSFPMQTPTSGRLAARECGNTSPNHVAGSRDGPGHPASGR